MPELHGRPFRHVKENKQIMENNNLDCQLYSLESSPISVEVVEKIIRISSFAAGDLGDYIQIIIRLQIIIFRPTTAYE